MSTPGSSCRPRFSFLGDGMVGGMDAPTGVSHWIMVKPEEEVSHHSDLTHQHCALYRNLSFPVVASVRLEMLKFPRSACSCHMFAARVLLGAHESADKMTTTPNSFYRVFSPRHLFWHIHLDCTMLIVCTLAVPPSPNPCLSVCSGRYIRMSAFCVRFISA